MVGLRSHEPSKLTTKSGSRYPGVKGQDSDGYEVREIGPRDSATRVRRETKGLEILSGWGRPGISGAGGYKGVIRSGESRGSQSQEVRGFTPA